MDKTIGILALQGGFSKHEEALSKLGVKTLLIRKPEQLKECDGLVIPGGESTTITKLMQEYNFYDYIREFAIDHSILGTCAGTIMLAKNVDDSKVEPLQLIDIDVSRNAYGRQIDSFITELKTPFLRGSDTFRAFFIRAPQIERMGNSTEVLIEFEGQPVMVREKNVIVITFHPELTDNIAIHKYFLDNLNN